MNKQIFKKLLPIFSMVMMALLAVSTVTFAWLAMNQHVESDGMKMSMTSSPNLVIATETGTGENGIANANIGTTMYNSNYKISYTSNRSEMAPAAHNWTEGPATGLWTVQNVWDIGYSTGIIKSGKTITSVGVAVSAESIYYIDYVCYIASCDAAMDMTGKKLEVTLSTATELTDDTAFLNAATVDFYVGAVASGTYKGSINIKDCASKKVSLWTATDGNIPLNTEGSLMITCRCYFDGSLEDVAGTSTYVRSDKVKTDNIALSLSYDVVTA